MPALEAATFLGLGAVAIWFYLRYPGLRPRTIVRAAVHVAVSFGLFELTPDGLRLCLLLPPPASVAVFVTLLLLPALLYVLLSWLWLIARLHELGSSTPRGGHPASARAG
jgi:hypothetical protein